MAAEISLAALPILDGVLDVMWLGIFSSLHPEELRLRRAIENSEAASAHARYPVLFDPQTAGGLLVSVPPERAEVCTEDLKTAGYTHAATIGTVRPATTSNGGTVTV